MTINKKTSLLNLLVLICLYSTLTSCSVNRNINDGENGTNHKLVFEDQFNGDAYNTKYWTSLPTQTIGAAWNRYVVKDPTLAEVKNGNLHMRARWNAKTDLPETGAIRSQDKFSFKYGKIEIRAKFNSAGQGGWPAIWLMPQNEIYKGWPNGGEIDIMERLNNDGFVHQVVHQTDGEAKKNSFATTAPINVDAYNTYGIIKLPNRIEFYVNDILTMVHESKGAFEKRWPFETDFYIILNHALADKGQSGTYYWPGKVTSTENLPYEMAIDYVKVWELNE
ncbi:glycoside hydrolase family 16 protein [Polaribacter sp. IC073]|nr:glycoside hydrolase family 16 protein [Polaribacter sp. IC073]